MEKERSAQEAKEEQAAKKWRKKALKAILSDSARALDRLTPPLSATSLLWLGASAESQEKALFVAMQESALDSFAWLMRSAIRDQVNLGGVRSEQNKHRSLLHEAASQGNMQMLNALLPFCDPNARDEEGNTALVAAALGGHDESVLALLGMTDPDARGKDGSTALMNAAPNVRPETLLAMMKSIDPKASSEDGNDALMWAAYWACLENVAALLPFSDPTRKNKEGKTAFQIAQKSLADDAGLAVFDLLATAAPDEEAGPFFEKLGAEKMPRWAAKREAREIRNAVEQSAGELEGASGASSRASRRAARL